MCLVLALDIIRSKAEAYGLAGVGPVLVLSYKNHALDEFLLDICHHFPKRLRPGMLIRTGKPDIDSLNEFTEKHSPIEYEAKEQLAEIVGAIRMSRNVVKGIYDCARNLAGKALLEVVEILDFYFYTLGMHKCRLVFNLIYRSQTKNLLRK